MAKYRISVTVVPDEGEIIDPNSPACISPGMAAELDEILNEGFCIIGIRDYKKDEDKESFTSLVALHKVNIAHLSKVFKDCDPLMRAARRAVLLEGPDARIKSLLGGKDDDHATE